MNGEMKVEASSPALQRLRQEAVRSDRFFAQDLFEQERGSDALAHLARAIDYDPASTLAAEMAVVMLNGWSYPIPSAICLGHSDDVNSAVFSRDGERILTASTDKMARIWEARTGKPLMTFVGHDNEVNDARFSPDGIWVVTASDDKTARLWEADSGRLVLTLPHPNDVNEVRFSPDGSRVVTYTDDDMAYVWEVSTGKLLVSMAHPDSLWSAEISPCGQLVLTTCNDGSARLWDANAGRLVNRLKHFEITPNASSASENKDESTSPDFLWAVAHFSPDGRSVLTTSSDKLAKLWEVGTGNLLVTFSGHDDEVTEADFSPDGLWVITQSRDKTVRLWEAENGRLAFSLQHPSRLWEVRFSPDGQRIFTFSEDDRVRVWSAKNGELLACNSLLGGDVAGVEFSADGERVLIQLRDRTVRVFETSPPGLGRTFRVIWANMPKVHFSPDGQRLLTAHPYAGVSESDSSLGCSIKVWNTSTGQLIAALHDADSTGSFSPDSRRVITCSREPNEKWALIWESDTGRLLSTLRGHEATVLSVAFSPDGRQVATSSDDRTVRLWDADTGQLQSVLPQPAREGYDYKCPMIFYSRNGQKMLTFSQDSTAAYVWDSRTGQLLLTLDGHGVKAVISWQWSPDSGRVVIASEDYATRIWDTTRGQLLTTIQVGSRPKIVQFSPDGKQLSVVTWNDVLVWDAATGEPIGGRKANEDWASWGRDLGLSRDGRRVLTTVAGESLAWLWDAESGKRLACLRGHRDEVQSAEFSPDGQLVATWSLDGVVRLWELLGTIAPPPWFADFLRLMAQKRINEDGELTLMSAEEFLASRSGLERIVAVEQSRCAAIARWLLAPAAQRVTRPCAS